MKDVSRSTAYYTTCFTRWYNVPIDEGLVLEVDDLIVVQLLVVACREEEVRLQLVVLVVEVLSVLQEALGPVLEVDDFLAVLLVVQVIAVLSVLQEALADEGPVLVIDVLSVVEALSFVDHFCYVEM
tara:strand:- start:273 stop:653 length:381 start_codon:yes stop_codon:yes gene_type:complete